MTHHRTIYNTCDGCGQKLRDSQPYIDLSSVGDDNYRTQLLRIGKNVHFCDLDCLDHWRAREKFIHAEMAAAWETRYGRPYETYHEILKTKPMTMEERQRQDDEIWQKAIAAYPMERVPS